MTIYDSQEQQIARLQQLAQALQQGGQFSPNRTTMSSGAYVVPISPFEGFSKLAQNAIGMLAQNRAAGDATDLSNKKSSDLASYIKGISNVQNTPDAIQPAQTTDSLQGQPTPQQTATQQNYDTGLADTQASSNSVNASNKSAMLAQYMKGLDMGGPAESIAGTLVGREIAPPVQQPYSLGPGDIRYDAKNQPIAVGAPKTQAEDGNQLVKIVDAAKKEGYRTIQRKQFKDGMQEWTKPDAAAAAANGLTGNALDQAADFYRKNGGKLPPGASRSPAFGIKIMNRAAEMDDAEGITTQAATTRKLAAQAQISALNDITKKQVNVSAFERNANKGLLMVRDLAPKVDNTGVPIFNEWLNAGKKKITGSTPLAQFSAAHETFVSEYAKIMSGSMGNSPATDTAAAHARGLLDTAQRPQDYLGVLDILEKEMQNRISGYNGERKDIMESMSGQGTYSAPGIPAAAPAAPAAPAPSGPKDFSKLWGG